LLWPSLLREVAEAKAPKTFMQSKADIRYRIKATEHKRARMFLEEKHFYALTPRSHRAIWHSTWDQNPSFRKIRK